MTNVSLTNEQTISIANFIYSYLNNYIEANEQSFNNFVSNLKKKGVITNA